MPMNTDSLIAIGAVTGGLLLTGAILHLTRLARVHAGWLGVCAALVLLNDAALTNLYGLLPIVLPGDWNWQGKSLSLLLTLAVAASPMFGWRNCGLTLRQESDGFRTALFVAAAYILFFVGLAVIFPNDAVSGETMAFQLTMPGLDEETFYRGMLLFALMKAFRERVALLGVKWSFGALISCVLFGLVHAYGYSDGAFSFDPVTMALTAVPSLLAVWLVLRTRSVLLPLVLHNFGNAIFLLI